MENLAGVKNSNDAIDKELVEAGISIHFEKAKGEVPYDHIGKRNGWKFERAWYYWVATSDEGLPFDVAMEIQERMGSVVRANGDCGCRGPEMWASPNGSAMFRELASKGIISERLNYGEVSEMYENGTLTDSVVPRFVQSYHIDSQVGLNFFISKLLEMKAKY